MQISMQRLCVLSFFVLFLCFCSRNLKKTGCELGYYYLCHLLTANVYTQLVLKYFAGPGNKAHRQGGNEGDRQGTSKLQYDVLRKNEAETPNSSRDVRKSLLRCSGS